jgi:competence protein ComEA
MRRFFQTCRLHRYLLAVVLTHGADLSLAGTDANLATEAELDSIKGLGPSSTARILKAREQSPFKDWADFLRRVKGFKRSSAERLSEAGLTVNGQPFDAPGQAKPSP